jgi:hypothetical protein
MAIANAYAPNEIAHMAKPDAKKRSRQAPQNQNKNHIANKKDKTAFVENSQHKSSNSKQIQDQNIAKKCRGSMGKSS